MTTATAVAADSSRNTLATTLASEKDEARARTTTPPLEGFEASSWSSLSSSSSVVEDSGAPHTLTSYNGADGNDGSAIEGEKSLSDNEERATTTTHDGFAAFSLS